ncbi:hypothetical protein QBC46DRAFT_451677 [Diplogelasinospora grovesii]|uniref:Uncharacterized protein n=1 Tax=Diplogelasinospora grovesii TaxID=303347 RepID=A0AAN6S281_9PEZI|nr:hypothetical protein QBC46DRAFT_451677 [Diplogelasinospora grovesii]
MSLRARACARARRVVHNRQIFFTALTLCVLWIFMVTLGPNSRWSRAALSFFPGSRRVPKRMPTYPPILPPLEDRVTCYGPRDQFLSRSPDDELKEVQLDVAYPLPWVGSYETLGLPTTWMTLDGRYGPYGYGEDRAGYGRKKVDWDRIDWGDLQNKCFERNAHRFPESARKLDNMLDTIRFGYRNITQIPEVRHWHEFKDTRRTAILVRAWEGYEYKQEDMVYLRSLIVETSLRTGAEYHVILLVNIKDMDRKIFSSPESYTQALKDAGIPQELQSIAVLWDDHLLASWYPDVPEHRTMWQVYQPVQLFALHYPEFDHFWQVELDMRFTGDAGVYLDRLSEFARNEPRKQALERATFQHMQSLIGDYDTFFAAVDEVNKGGSWAWGPVHVPEIEPVGPAPPTKLPQEEDFQWGRGEEADVIVTSLCNNASAATSWVFRDWIGGFGQGMQTPRFFCPPAITRQSRSLLFVAHEAQLGQGLRVPSEATPASFALWHGLKLSYPPQPVFWRDPNDIDYQLGWWKGGPRNSSTGIGPDSIDHPRGDGLSFWWESSWPRQVFDAWDGKPLEEGVHFPWILTKEEDGRVYIPNMMMHPMKHR